MLATKSEKRHDKIKKLQKIKLRRKAKVILNRRKIATKAKRGKK